MANLKNTSIDDTGFLNLPAGSTAERPASPPNGSIRLNTDFNRLEYYNNEWNFLTNLISGFSVSGNVETSKIVENGVTYRVHIYYGSGSFTPQTSGWIEYLVVAGGGGGGFGNSNEAGGGGGAGGMVTGTTSVTNQQYTITVGAGGTPGPSTSTPAGDGQDSTAFGLTAIGGGGGGSCRNSGRSGGSGGGGSGCSQDRPGGTAVQPTSTDGGFGNPGGSGRWISNSPGGGNGGGGGGAGSAGEDGETDTDKIPGRAGSGKSSTITGFAQMYSQGGPGGPGGRDGNYSPTPNAPANTGFGAGGGTDNPGGTGASGIVVIRYPINENIGSKTSSLTSDMILNLDGGNLQSLNLLSPEPIPEWVDLTGNESAPLSTDLIPSGDAGGCMTFNGVNDDFEISAPAVGSPNYFSLIVWVKPTSTSSGRYLTPRTNGIDNFLSSGGNDLSVTYCESADTNGRGISTSNNAAPINQWHHVGLTINRDTASFYVNGNLVGSRTESFNIGSWQGNWRIGQRSNGSFWFEGSIASIRVWNKIMGDLAIAEDYKATKGRFGK